MQKRNNVQQCQRENCNSLRHAIGLRRTGVSVRFYRGGLTVHLQTARPSTNLVWYSGSVFIDGSLPTLGLLYAGRIFLATIHACASGLKAKPYISCWRLAYRVRRWSACGLNSVYRRGKLIRRLSQASHYGSVVQSMVGGCGCRGFGDFVLFILLFKLFNI